MASLRTTRPFLKGIYGPDRFLLRRFLRPRCTRVLSREIFGRSMNCPRAPSISAGAGVVTPKIQVYKQHLLWALRYTPEVDLKGSSFRTLA